MFELFVLVATLCSPISGQCDSYAIDHNLSASACDAYFTDSGLFEVDRVIYTIEREEGRTMDLQGLSCVVEDTE